MSEQFDPYRKWLGISAEDQPPTYYRLLGLSAFESDPEVISNAADRQMAHVRSFQTGKYSVYSQELLNQLATARVCLLDPARKTQYDAQLRAALATRVTLVPITPEMASSLSSIPVGTPVSGPGSPPTPWQSPPMGAALPSVGMAMFPGQRPFSMPPAGVPAGYPIAMGGIPFGQIPVMPALAAGAPPYLPPGVVPAETLPDEVAEAVAVPLGSMAFGQRRGSSQDSTAASSSALRRRRANSSRASLIMAVLGLAVILALAIVAWKSFEEEPIGLPGVAPDKKPKVHAPAKPAPAPEEKKPASHATPSKHPNL